jgi:hypothetical protein
MNYNRRESFAFLQTLLSPFTRTMARWPKNHWTTMFTYGAIFVAFPVLCLLAYAWVQRWF